MTNTTTPTGINKHVRALCRQLDTGYEPVFIPVRTRAGAIHAECFQAVTNQVAQHGGEALNGWLIWEWPGILVEAEFHAVWVSPAGELVDVSLHPHGEERTLFLPDPEKLFTGTRVDNVRRPAGSNPLVPRYIADTEHYFDLMRKLARNPSLANDARFCREVDSLQARLRETTLRLERSRESRRASSRSSRKQSRG